MAPKKWRPGYKRAAKKNIRMGMLKPLLGKKADWKAITGTIKDVIAELPAIAKSAAEISGAVISGGATAASVAGNPAAPTIAARIARAINNRM